MYLKNIYLYIFYYLLRCCLYSSRTTGPGEENNNAERNDDDEQDPEENPIPAVMPRVPCAKKGKEGFETQLINLLKLNQASSNQTSMLPQDNDADKLFLLSLLPKMKALNSSASFDFQIQVMQLLQSYLSDDKNLLNQPPVSQPSTFHAIRNLPTTPHNSMEPIPPDLRSLNPVFVTSPSHSTSQSVLSPVSDTMLSPTDIDTVLSSEDSVLSFHNL